MPTKDVQDKIAEEIEKLNKDYGKGTIQTLDADSHIEVERYVTESASWNHVMGGGLPKGRVIEIFGEASTGKTSSCYFLAGQVQKQGGTVAWIDLECAFETEYAAMAGIDLESKTFSLSTPNNGEEAIDATLRLAKAGVSLIVIDSVAQLVPQKELDGDIQDQHMALQARLLGKALRMITPVIHKTGATVIFINQMRSTMATMAFAAKSDSTGGKALKFYSSVRVETKRIETLKDADDQARGIKIKLENRKCKVGKPFRTAEIEYDYDIGFDLVRELFDLALAAGVIKQEGTKYSFGEIPLGTGVNKAKDKLTEDEELAKAIREELAKR